MRPCREENLLLTGLYPGRHGNIAETIVNSSTAVAGDTLASRFSFGCKKAKHGSFLENHVVNIGYQDVV